MAENMQKAKFSPDERKFLIKLANGNLFSNYWYIPKLGNRKYQNVIDFFNYYAEIMDLPVVFEKTNNQSNPGSKMLVAYTKIEKITIYVSENIIYLKDGIKSKNIYDQAIIEACFTDYMVYILAILQEAFPKDMFIQIQETKILSHKAFIKIAMDIIDWKLVK